MVDKTGIDASYDMHIDLTPLTAGNVLEDAPGAGEPRSCEIGFGLTPVSTFLAIARADGPFEWAARPNIRMQPTAAAAIMSRRR